MSRFLTRFRNNIGGATAIEYCLIAGSLALVIIATVNTLGANLNANFFSQVAGIAAAAP